MRFTVAAIPDPVPLPSLLIAIKDSDKESKCIRFQYTKETFHLCEYFCRKHISRRKKWSIKKKNCSSLERGSTRWRLEEELVSHGVTES